MKRISFLLLCLGFICYSFAQMTITVKKPGTLAETLTQEQRDTCTTLTVKGKLNSADIRVLRRMAGCDGGTTGKLAHLDLQDATFVTDKESPYLTLDAAKASITVQTWKTGTDRSLSRLRPSSSYEWMGEEDNLRYFNKKPRYRPLTDVRKPTYTIEHSSGWTITPQRETRFLENGREGVKREMMVTLHKDNGIYRTQIPEYKEGKNSIMFSEDVDVQKWNKLQRKGMRQLKGHSIKLENGRYIYRAYTCRNRFCADMFYGCTSLESVVVPKNATFDGRITLGDSPIQYF